MLQYLKKLEIDGLKVLAEETRREIIETVSKNGGHLAPSLGTVDLTVALLKVFSPPEDKIVWDVGHQAYAYKILTDRKEEFRTLRKFQGVSGFPKMSESPFDAFGAGHGGASISAAMGIEEALRKKGDNSRVIAIIGDGAMTSGLAFEAMNQSKSDGRKFITILNDNDMSISTSVGALSAWFSRKFTGQAYNMVRHDIKAVLSKLPPFFRGEKIIEIIRKTLESSKSLLTPGILFEGLGFQYVGPIDGHNLDELVNAFKDIKYNECPVLLHIVTKKGKGYEPAEENPRKFHGLGPFKIDTGESSTVTTASFTSYLGKYLPPLFKRNDRLVAITAAMPDGTGLTKLQEDMPDRVFDVGMAEGHAVTFAAGLAAGGLKPVVAIYSTFLQRSFDSIIHDVALQNLPVIFLVDRAGIVGEDGPTHHGIFDIAYFRIIPNIVVMAPRDEVEMARMLELAVKMTSPVVIRYPRGSAIGKRFYNRVTAIKEGCGEFIKKVDSDTLIVTVGITARYAVDAYSVLKKENIHVSIYDLKFIKPLPEDLFDYIKKNRIKRLVVHEEGIIGGGAGSHILEELSKRGLDVRCRLVGIDDKFPVHGTQKEVRDLENISAFGLVESVKKLY